MHQKFHSSINHSSLVTLYLFIIPILFSEYKNIVLLLFPVFTTDYYSIFYR